MRYFFVWLMLRRPRRRSAPIVPRLEQLVGALIFAAVAVALSLLTR